MAGEDDFTVDTLLRGRVTFLQPVKGYRSSLDPVLLAGFLSPPHGRFLDIGCGCGVLSFLLAAADPASSGVALEIQPRLARLARLGVERNGLASRLQVVEGDARRVPLAPGTFDTVASNPPFREVGKGPASPDEERARANHELTLRLGEWLHVAASALRPGGRMGVVFPAERSDELQDAARARGLLPARLRLAQPRPDRPASRVLLEATAGTGPSQPTIEPPLVLHEADGSYTAEVRRMLGELV